MHILQKKILQFAQDHDLSQMGLRKIGNMINEKYPQKVKHHLIQLEKNGYVKLDPEQNRIIRTLKKGKIEKGAKIFNIPVFGYANAGPATMFAEQNIEGYLPISRAALSSRPSSDGLFAIRVVGDSLNQASIGGEPVNNNDYVIIDGNRNIPNNGEYVLSIVDDMANLKRFYREGNEIRLVSESSLNIPPIILHEEDLNSSGYSLNGTIIKVIKN